MQVQELTSLPEIVSHDGSVIIQMPGPVAYVFGPGLCEVLSQALSKAAFSAELGRTEVILRKPAGRGT